MICLPPEHPILRFFDPCYHVLNMEKRLFVAIGAGIVLFSIWPAVTLFNRVQPFILGLPPFVFFSLVVFAAVPAFLFAALARKI